MAIKIAFALTIQILGFIAAEYISQRRYFVQSRDLIANWIEESGNRISKETAPENHILAWAWNLSRSLNFYGLLARKPDIAYKNYRLITKLFQVLKPLIEWFSIGDARRFIKFERQYTRYFIICKMSSKTLAGTGIQLLWIEIWFLLSEIAIAFAVMYQRIQ